MKSILQALCPSVINKISTCQTRKFPALLNLLQFHLPWGQTELAKLCLHEPWSTTSTVLTIKADTTKLTGPWALINKNWVQPVKFLQKSCLISARPSLNLSDKSPKVSIVSVQVTIVCYKVSLAMNNFMKVLLTSLFKLADNGIVSI